MSAEAAPLAPGSRVDGLRIERLIGRGAFGVVYRCRDESQLEAFALKEFLPAGLVRRGPDGQLEAVDEPAQQRFEDGLQRFLAAGQTAARLNHPNLAQALRCFEANGTAYLLMPHYEGEALDRLLARGGTLSVEETLALARPLLDALDYLHRNGLVHQDVKPANILVTRDGRPILLDFGASGGVEPGKIPRGPRHGSEGYAAIEQYAQDDATGPWTDVYGLAATLYRCLGGHIPAPAPERRDALVAGQPDPLPELLPELLPDLAVRNASGAPHALAEAIAAGLTLEPAARPRSVAEWRRQFGAATVANTQEGREWLPMILLGIFALTLLGAVAWLLLAPGSDDRAAVPTARTTPDASPSSVASPAAAAEETARWQAALEADGAVAYQRFLADFPDSIHRDQARIHLRRLDDRAFQQARAEGSREALEAYLQRFPGGGHETDARIALEELRRAEEDQERARAAAERQDDEAWEAARRARNIAAVDAYLANWPAGRHGDEARKLRQALQAEADERRAFEAARKLDSVESWQAYIDAFPRGVNVAAALEAIEALTPRPGRQFRDCADCPLMVVLPAGSFWQGSDEAAPGVLRKETPRRLVTLAEPFAVGVHEITLAQWDLCVAEGGCATRAGDNGWGRGERPAIMVSWNDAVEFTAWLSTRTGEAYSLPSESQWEYAARAGEESDWPGGDPARVCEFANVAGAESGLRWRHEACADPAALSTLPVGSLRPNAFGLHDVVGNVAEWTLDCMNLSYLDAPVDGSAWSRGICSSRMTRGGSWFTGSRDIRLPARFNLKNGDRNDFTGFRVVRKVDS
jgi:formylglycine-generating enzyme required for sulfatase activity